ncbi:uncharacterized protein LOC124342275 [Daphnia pulicaria]|uniref:uncharacterized protein LOC124342275 n=1 Tax=Daphnia pulicaria TaxID=35523 RepID=UPI001EEAA998|nr:uncharacterized protein LOC124342275 [Daphnia pulicaria]
MELPDAQKEFMEILHRAKDPSVINGFLSWVKENWFAGDNNLNIGSNETAIVVNGVEADELLENIATDLRQLLPMEAQLPSETIIFPKTGQNADCHPATTLNVDGFLYDDRLVDALCDEGKLPKNYCTLCGSRNTKPLTFISHSASRDNLAHAFRNLLPDLSGKHLLDVGSRFGAVLFGAFAYSHASRITGVEINQQLAALSLSMVQKYSMQSRVEVFTGDIRQFPHLVSSADVVVMHNVFEFFAPPEVQRDLWLALRQLIKRGALILTSPSLDQALSTLDTNIQLDQWVELLSQPSNIASSSMDDDDDDDDDEESVPEMDLVHLYRVLCRAHNPRGGRAERVRLDGMEVERR